MLQVCCPRSMMVSPLLCADFTSVGWMDTAMSMLPDCSAWNLAVESPIGLNTIWSTCAALAASQ